MEMFEKETEKITEVEKVPNKEYASKGVGTAGLTLGIIGTALGAYALNRHGIGLFGNNYGMPENVNINANLGNSNTPSTFQTWEKECEDMMKV